MGRDPVSVPEVFTLVPRDDRPDRQLLTPELPPLAPTAARGRVVPGGDGPALC
jgi:hypothetical protein